MEKVIYTAQLGRTVLAVDYDFDKVVTMAKEAIKTKDSRPGVLIWRDEMVVVAVITDDANAITVHKLNTF